MKLRRDDDVDVSASGTREISGIEKECAYCGGRFRHLGYSIGGDGSFHDLNCVAGYAVYIEGVDEETTLRIIMEQFGQPATLPPPPQDMRHWDPSGTVDYETLLAQQFETMKLAQETEVMGAIADAERVNNGSS